MAVIWFGVAHVMGTVMSKVILSLVYVLVTTPIGVLRRVFGADPMRLKGWRAGGSAFDDRDHTFVAKDLETPF